MPSKILSCGLKGIDGYGLEIEVDILNGLPRFTIVGLGDTAVQESKERVRSAIVNSGADFPRRRKIINLAPADLKKSGPSFDLPMAIGLLVASGQIPQEAVKEALFIGELALDGSLRPTQGILSVALFSEQHPAQTLFVPEANAYEAHMGSSLTIYPVSSLKQLILHLQGKQPLLPFRPAIPLDAKASQPDFSLLSSIGGLEKWIPSLAVTAAGGHHILMIGPPGSGKTLLAQCLPSLLPPLYREEQLELSQIYSIAGLLPSYQPLIQQRPFRSIHHTASIPALIGGGKPIRPGEISLAHRGVLFLDEVAEFPRALLETLRQPLEDRMINISRASGSLQFPSHFTLAAAMNPCPCGYHGDPVRACHCSGSSIAYYSKKLSGPFLDRIDLRLKIPRLSFRELSKPSTLDFKKIYQSILRARAIQTKRFGNELILNSDMTPHQVEQYCELDPLAEKFLHKLMDSAHLSGRAYSRLLKVSRTIADINASPLIKKTHLMEAACYRLNNSSNLVQA